MSRDFEVTGADEFYAFSKALKAAGRADLRKELNKALRDASKPLIRQVKAAARAELPKRGGLAETVARSPIRAQVRTGATTAGVRITARGQGLRGTNRGVVRHPVFGNREIFVEQEVNGGWFDDTLRAGAPTVRPHLEAAIEAVAEKVVRETKGGR